MNQQDQRAYSYIHHHSILQKGTPHDLIIKVGASGPYQNNIFYITIVLWYISGVIIFQTPFLFLEPEFQFPSNQQSLNICTVQENMRRTFYAPNTINTINSQLGPFVCQYLFILGLLKSIIFFGGLIGYLAYTTCLDNYGRKFSLIFTSVCICFGSLLLMLCTDLLWIGVGLFLIGIGRTVTRVTILIINQICDQSMRQRSSVVLQVYMGLSGFSIALGYYIFRDWRTFNLITVLIPTIIVLFIIIYYVQQTPTFLLLKTQQQTLRALNRIGKINLNLENILQKQDIDHFYSQSNLKRMKKQVTYKDMFTLPSLKTNVYGISIVGIFSCFLYYAPIFIINQLSINIYVSMVAFSAVQFVGYVAMLFIQKTPRRLVGLWVFYASTFLTGILIFIKIPEDCQKGECFQSYFQLFCVFLARLLCTYYSTILTLYQNEIFPTKARGVCLGFASAIGSVSTTLVNIVIGFCLQYEINIMIVFTLSGLAAAYGVSFLPQTLNIPLEDEVQEFKKSKLLSQKKQQNQIQLIDKH